MTFRSSEVLWKILKYRMDIIALSSETISRLNKALKECDFCSFGFESLKRLESGVLLGSFEPTLPHLKILDKGTLTFC